VLGWLPPGATAGRLTIDHRPAPLAGGELAELIGESRLLVYPSSYEGFGLPPIESYALGTPAIYRRTEAAAEVMLDVPGGFATEDQGEFDRAATEALGVTDAELERLSRAMWERYDWAGVATRVAAALRAE
jgi:glycosyltransferase involved in cell wall biosynthesis